MKVTGFSPRVIFSQALKLLPQHGKEGLSGACEPRQQPPVQEETSEISARSPWTRPLSHNKCHEHGQCSHPANTVVL